MMQEPWNFKTSDDRSIDSIISFMIFCEDEAVEPNYFELFRKENLHITAHKNFKQHHIHVSKVSEFFRKKGILTYNGTSEILALDDGAFVWCVFDRDKNSDDGKDSDFNDSIQNAESKGIKVAWSNDAFELWVLLHFEEVDPKNDLAKSRKYYYERLTEIIKNVPENQKNELHKRITANEKFHYDPVMKRANCFLQITYPLMKSQTVFALQRAEKLEHFFSSCNIPPHEMAPLTNVHHLVKELLKYGKDQTEKP